MAAIALHKFPLSNHSKVDRRAIKALPLPKKARAVQQNAELMETMLQLRGVWRGNSLLIIRLQSQIRIAFNVALSLHDLLSANTLSDKAHTTNESANVAPLDWDAETAPPPIIPTFLDQVSKTCNISQVKKTNKAVVVTGATGFLAKYVIPKLAARPDVETIHCVAVRDPAKLNHRQHKARCYVGDLSTPLLGLSTEDFVDLASQVDVILHIGAARFFWDNYNILRPSNVNPTKELIKLAAPGKVPIHFMSTAAIFGDNCSIDRVSAADSTHALAGTNGYTATKWASERILERSGGTLGVPSVIHRFAPATNDQPAFTELLNLFTHYVELTKARPDATGWSGCMGMIPATKVASWLCELVMANVTSTGASFTHYPGQFGVSVSELMPHLEDQMGQRDDLVRVPLLRWTGVIKKAGVSCGKH